MEVYKLFFKWFEANHLPTALLAKAHDGAAIVKMNAASESYLAGYMQAKQEVDEVHDAEPLDLTDSCGNRDCIICGDGENFEDSPEWTDRFNPKQVV
jgi:hypothetical protein